MTKLIAVLILTAFCGLILFTNTLVVKVDGFQTLQCATHHCYKVGNTIYMVK